MNKDKPKSNRLLAVFYFLLIFCIVIYLFFALFDRPVGSSVDTEMMIFKNDTFSEPNHSIIMKFPEFAIKKSK
jgi:hypothetical protein